ncbi:replicative DNA helicase [Hymenobacter cheonanensis]|uniref:replicative DNA helicase n=1 Tax=Hymenobacter sp. CA2-7 TaxID=3063993 RepID=UPI00271254E9|nr:replicative DNA helicase [Hymenobacter sp. CA2-7]MDO7887965.1 replicative DNA helicase [Hymenobacter sp. CA2-7]
MQPQKFITPPARPARTETLPPPSAPDIEAAVLGAMLFEAPAVATVLALLRANANVFYIPAHQHVFRAIVTLSTSGQAVDTLTVVQQLAAAGKLSEVGGPASVAGLATYMSGAGILPTHCAVLLEHYTKREIWNVATELLGKARSPMVAADTLLADAYATLNSLSTSMQVRRPQLVGELYDRVVDKIVAASQVESGITGVPSGLWALDRITGGWQPGNLIIEAARPGMGKTSLMLATARKAVAAGYPGMISSLEMSSEELVTKMLATELQYTTNQLTRGIGLSKQEAESIRERGAALRQMGMVLDDTPGINIEELRAKATKAKQEHGITWLAVDYLQLATARAGKGGNREQEISAISRGLKLIAKELHIPVIALSQLSRDTEKRGGDNKPKLSDLRESGAIEQDADLVIFPYRPEYYKIMEDEMGNPTTDLTELIVAKHRNGGLGTALVRSVMRTGAYSDLPENEPHVVGAIETVLDYQPLGIRVGTAGDFGQPAPLASMPVDPNAPF